MRCFWDERQRAHAPEAEFFNGRLHPAAEHQGRVDAILGAIALGDIGRHFPDNDPRWKDASSIDLLRRAVALVHGEGYQVGNVDVTVILERPKIRDYVDVMRQVVANALEIGVDRVSIKGKTNEGVDAVGRGEAIAAHAVALLRRV